MRTVLLPMNRPVIPPPLRAGGGADEPLLLLGTVVGGTPPPFVVVVPVGAWPVGPGVLPCAVGVPAVLLDAPGVGEPPSLVADVTDVAGFPDVAGVSAVELEDDATACGCGELVPTTAATTPTTATTATAAQTLRCANNWRLRPLLTAYLPT